MHNPSSSGIRKSPWSQTFFSTPGPKKEQSRDGWSDQVARPLNVIISTQCGDKSGDTARRGRSRDGRRMSCESWQRTEEPRLGGTNVWHSFSTDVDSSQTRSLHTPNIWSSCRLVSTAEKTAVLCWRFGSLARIRRLKKGNQGLSFSTNFHLFLSKHFFQIKDSQLCLPVSRFLKNAVSFLGSLHSTKEGRNF